MLRQLLAVLFCVVVLPWLPVNLDPIQGAYRNRSEARARLRLLAKHGECRAWDLWHLSIW